METMRPTENTILIKTENGYYPVQCYSKEAYKIIQKDMVMFKNVDQAKMQALANWLESTKIDKVLRYSKTVTFLEAISAHLGLPQDFIKETLASECYEIETFEIENLTYVYIH